MLKLIIDRYLLSFSRSLNEFDNGGIDLMKLQHDKTLKIHTSIKALNGCWHRGWMEYHINRPY